MTRASSFPHRWAIRPLARLAVVAATTVAAACGGTGETSPATVGDQAAQGAALSAATPGTPDSAPSPGVAAGAAGTDSAFVGTVAPTVGGTDRAGVATLLAVRTSPRATDGVWRVVFEFDGDSLPPYEIAYARPPFAQCGSGQPVAISGTSVLRLRLHTTRAHAESGTEMLPTVTERDRKLDQALFRQLTLTCDFEAEVEWLLGVSARSPYRVLELRSPARLVVDMMDGRASVER